MSDRAMDAHIRRVAGRGPGRGREVEHQDEPAFDEEVIQDLAATLGLTRTEAIEKLRAASAGPPEIPPGNAGSGTATPPRKKVDMNEIIRRKARGWS